MANSLGWNSNLSKSRDENDAWALVLGGSEGIGFSFAKRLAHKQGHLILIARRRKGLLTAKRKLLDCGARDVKIIAGDLLCSKFRIRLFRRLAKTNISKLFIGGPSPPLLDKSKVSARSARAAFECCVTYPVQTLMFALGLEARSPLKIILLSSSTSTEGTSRSPFFLSALFRGVGETALLRVKRSYSKKGVSFQIWRPRVVFTPLAQRFARGLHGFGTQRSLKGRLSVFFKNCKVPTADEYVDEMFVHSRARVY